MNVQSILGTKGFDVATVGQEASLADAAAQLRDRGVGALVVSDDGRHIDGIVSERDVVRALAAHGAGGARPHRRLGDVDDGRHVRRRRLGRGPDVVDDRAADPPPARSSTSEGLLAGIVSIGDVVKARLGQLQVENEALTEYIHQGR